MSKSFVDIENVEGLNRDVKSGNYVINENLDVDVNLNALETSNISAEEEKEIDKMFELDDEAMKAQAGKATSKKKKKPQSEIDFELVNAFVKNPTHTTFNKLWERYYFGVKGHAFKFVKDWDLADDLTCQTFERAWFYKDMYDITKAKFSTWLYTICRNLALGEIQRRKKENNVPNDISDMFDSTMLTSSIASSTQSTQYFVDNGEVTANSAGDLETRMYDTSLMEIDKLGGNYAKILRMKLVDDMKIKDIAKALNMNESTVKNYLYKGKDTIAAIMQKKHKSLYEMYQESTNDEDAKMMY